MLNPLNADLQAKLANYQNIPQELQALPQWVCWKYEDIGAAKPTKIPYHPKGFKASHSDANTWSTFSDVVNAVSYRLYDGIGFVFSENDPYAFIDLDEAGSDWLATERQLKIFKEFDSYSEQSPSGQGLHIIIKGKIPNGRKRSKIEIYSSLRYATFTGQVFNKKPIEERQELLNVLWEQMGASIPNTMMFTGDEKETLSDKEVIEQAKEAKNADKFIKLLEGEWRDIYNSQSEADLAFIDIIAFYSRNRSQIKRIFRASSLGQREKAEREDYVNWMINKSFDNMLPPIDLDGINIAIEKLKEQISQGRVAQIVEPKAHNFQGVGASPTAPTNKQEHSSTVEQHPLKVKVEGSNPSVPAKRQVDLPPGLLGEIATFIYQAAPRPVPEIALAGAIGLMAGIAGRAYNVSATGLNQYVLLLAPTGRGKEAMASGINKLINAVKQQVPTVTEFLGPDEIASGQALYKYLSTSKSFVSILSEFGLRLMQMADADGASPSTSLRRMFLQLYAKSGFTDVANPSIYSDKDRNIAAIQSPAFSILGESTPFRFYQNLNEDMITEGLLPRFLLIEYDGPRVPENSTHYEIQPSFSLIERLVTLAANAQTVQNASPRRVINVNFHPQSKAIADAFGRHCDSIINDSGTNQVVVELWNRAHLKVLKLAATVAVGVNMYEPVIEASHINWAIDMVTNDIATLSLRFEKGAIGASTAESKQVEDLLRITKEYIMADFDKVKKYLDKNDKSEVLHTNKVIPYSYISRRLIAQTAFKGDRLGSTNAIKRCLQIMVDRDCYREISRSEMTNRFGSTQKAYVVSDMNVLR